MSDTRAIRSSPQLSTTDTRFRSGYGLKRIFQISLGNVYRSQIPTKVSSSRLLKDVSVIQDVSTFINDIPWNIFFKRQGTGSTRRMKQLFLLIVDRAVGFPSDSQKLLSFLDTGTIWSKSFYTQRVRDQDKRVRREICVHMGEKVVWERKEVASGRKRDMILGSRILVVSNISYESKISVNWYNTALKKVDCIVKRNTHWSDNVYLCPFVSSSTGSFSPFV